MNRKALVSEFWSTVKNGHTKHPYTDALHRVLDTVEGRSGMKNQFVPVGSCRREVALEFNSGDCCILVNGVKIATLTGDALILEKFVSSAATGLAVDDAGRVVLGYR